MYIEDEPALVAANPLQEQLDQMTAAYNAQVKRGQTLQKQRDLAMTLAQNYAQRCDSLLMDITGNIETDSTMECSENILNILKLLED